MPFTPEAPQFLFENYSRNDKAWFKEHKEDYQRLILEPFAEMITALAPLMKDIDPMIVVDCKRVSRIYRDVRLIKDGRFFRQSVWCSLMRPKERFESKPEFYFWISPDNFGWGCGYYKAPTEVMESIRKMITDGDSIALEAVKAYEAQQSLKLMGESYKRDKFPDQPENLKRWLNLKNISLNHEDEDGELFFSDKLTERVYADLKAIAPVYRLFIEAQSRTEK